MTYADLLKSIQSLDPKRLDDTVTVYVDTMDEFLPVGGFKLSDETTNDVLDNGHAFMEVK
jgi:hypothetical protein